MLFYSCYLESNKGIILEGEILKKKTNKIFIKNMRLAKKINK